MVTCIHTDFSFNLRTEMQSHNTYNINSNKTSQKTYKMKIWTNVTDKKLDDAVEYSIFEDDIANQIFIHEIENNFICTPECYMYTWQSTNIGHLEGDRYYNQYCKSSMKIVFSQIQVNINIWQKVSEKKFKRLMMKVYTMVSIMKKLQRRMMKCWQSWVVLTQMKESALYKLKKILIIYMNFVHKMNIY